jgi:hypothetical protein
VTLFVSVVVAILATGGAASALWHLGRDLRQYKQHDRSLAVGGLKLGSRLKLVGAAVLILLIAAGAFYRVYSEAMFSAYPQLSLLLAVLVGVVMLLSASLTFGVAFRDGSPTGDDLRYYSKLVNRRLAEQQDHEKEAQRCSRDIDLLLSVERDGDGFARVELVRPDHEPQPPEQRSITEFPDGDGALGPTVPA